MRVMAAPQTARTQRVPRGTCEQFPRDTAVERVTGIEPAQSAWKAWDSKRHISCSTPSEADAVPSACLSATLAGRKNRSALSVGPSHKWQRIPTATEA